MSTAPSLGIPELAGLATYEEAARVGYSVDENVRRLLRLHWAERRLMHIALSHLPATPEWEVKCALALHQWQDAEHAEALRRRVGEMRSPPPGMDEAPDEALDAWLEEVRRARGTPRRRARGARAVGGLGGASPRVPRRRRRDRGGRGRG